MPASPVTAMPTSAVRSVIKRSSVFRSFHSSTIFGTRRHEYVAFAAYSADELRVLGIGFDLLTQTQDAKVYAAIERVPIVLSAQVQDALARQDAVRMVTKSLE